MTATTLLSGLLTIRNSKASLSNSKQILRGPQRFPRTSNIQETFWPGSSLPCTAYLWSLRYKIQDIVDRFNASLDCDSLFKGSSQSRFCAGNKLHEDSHQQLQGKPQRNTPPTSRQCHPFNLPSRPNVCATGMVKGMMTCQFSFVQQPILKDFSRISSERFPFISWGSGGWRCVRRTWLRRLQPFATVHNCAQCRLGKAFEGGFFMDGWCVSLCRYSIVKCYSMVSCKKGDAFHCAGAESDAFASHCSFSAVL